MSNMGNAKYYCNKCDKIHLPPTGEKCDVFEEHYDSSVNKGQNCASMCAKKMKASDHTVQ